MSADTTDVQSVAKTIRLALGIGGGIAVILGLLILFWPAKIAAIGTAIIAIYAIATGLVYAGLAIFSKRMSVLARVGHGALALLFVVSGIVALANLGDATVFIAIIVAVFIGVTWIVEGVVALTTLSASSQRGWTIFFALVSVIAGIALIFSPVYGAAFLWIFVGVSSVLLGVLQIIRAITFNKAAL